MKLEIEWGRHNWGLPWATSSLNSTQCELDERCFSLLCWHLVVRLSWLMESPNLDWDARYAKYERRWFPFRRTAKVKVKSASSTLSERGEADG